MIIKLIKVICTVFQRRNESQFFILFLGQMNIPSVEQFRYLGIIFSVNNFDLDIKRQMKKNVHLLLRKYSKSPISVKNVFKTSDSNFYCAPM